MTMDYGLMDVAIYTKDHKTAENIWYILDTYLFQPSRIEKIEATNTYFVGGQELGNFGHLTDGTVHDLIDEIGKIIVEECGDGVIEGYIYFYYIDEPDEKYVFKG